VRDDQRLASELADAAGALLRNARAGLFDRFGGDPGALQDQADALAQEFIADWLHRERPRDHVLSEEAPDDPSRRHADRVWIVDPLDGTREYARAGRADWAVHIALWERAANGLTAGAVALPDQDLLLTTCDPIPTDVVEPREGTRLRLVVSGSRRPAVVDDLARELSAEISTWGSAGAKAARVITGVDDVYLHDTDLNEWDAAAPVAVAQAHGLVATALDGSPLEFNKASAINGSLLMGRPDVLDRVRVALDSLA
jgi:3'(2'), 5'-bisphosphate nucleotidase